MPRLPTITTMQTHLPCQSFIQRFSPLFLSAYEAGDLRLFYETVLTTWFDVRAESSENPLIMLHNRFVRFFQAEYFEVFV